VAKADKLYVTNAECAERIGISTDEFNAIEATLTKAGFPLKDPLFNNRRYWPAVRAYLDKRNGLASAFIGTPGPPDEPGPWKKGREVW